MKYGIVIASIIALTACSSQESVTGNGGKRIEKIAKTAEQLAKMGCQELLQYKINLVVELSRKELSEAYSKFGEIGYQRGTSASRRDLSG